MPFKRDGENQPKEVWQLAGCKVQNPTKWIPILKERVRNNTQLFPNGRIFLIVNAFHLRWSSIPLIGVFDSKICLA
ncbi:hypothetical protein ABW02_25250 [Niallia circulans]|uniref:Uncharacterized protein n=1 Tax=Niallia circulans TaxID=1397 RepID=A0A0J1HRP8_NIACI|nr:hypothetical protein ABW02_25250 [Niallia circulans]